MWLPVLFIDVDQETFAGILLIKNALNHSTAATDTSTEQNIILHLFSPYRVVYHYTDNCLLGSLESYKYSVCTAAVAKGSLCCVSLPLVTFLSWLKDDESQVHPGEGTSFHGDCVRCVICILLFWRCGPRVCWLIWMWLVECLHKRLSELVDFWDQTLLRSKRTLI